MENNKRIFGYDLIKTIAIFLIVFYHLGGLDYGTISPDTYYCPNLNKFLTSFCAAGVPLFLMVNGALVLPKQLNLKQTITKSLHLLFILVFWKVVLQYLIAESLLSIKDDMVHFWFLGTLSVVYLISFFLNQNRWIKILCLVFLFLYPFLSNFIYDLIIISCPEHIPVFWKHTGFFTIYAIFYFYLGDFLKKKESNVFQSFLLILLGLVLINFEVVVMSNHFHIIYDGVNSSFPTFGAMTLSVGLFILLKNSIVSNHWIKAFVSLVGRNTMGIYLFHVLVLFVVRRFSTPLISDISIISAVLISLLVILITALGADVLNYSNGFFLVNSSNSSLKSALHLFPFFKR